MSPVSWSSTALAISVMSYIGYFRAAAACGDTIQFATAAAVQKVFASLDTDDACLVAKKVHCAGG